MARDDKVSNVAPPNAPDPILPAPGTLYDRTPFFLREQRGRRRCSVIFSARHVSGRCVWMTTVTVSLKRRPSPSFPTVGGHAR